jgi:hypothetical protein
MSGPEAVVALVFFGGTFLVLRPVAAALAKRIAGETPRRRNPESDDVVLGELQALRQDVEQLAERLDFAERLLAQQREPQRVGPRP